MTLEQIRAARKAAQAAGDFAEVTRLQKLLSAYAAQAAGIAPGTRFTKAQINAFNRR